jgi:hypothetical protein
MRARAGARSFAGMTARSIPAIALVALGATAAPAHAAGLVYGGTTRDGDAIVLTAPKAAHKLAGAVIAWHATCDDQSNFSEADRLTAVKPVAGVPLDRGDLLMTRNAKGRFTGTQAFGEQNDTSTAMVSVSVNGRLGRTSASGTLSATVKITDKATGATAGACQTGTVRWAAAHAPGKVYGGSTARDAPVVVHMLPRQRRVHDILVGWDTQSCTDGSYHVYPDGFTNFPVSRTGAFGNPFSYTASFSDGSKRAFAYDLRGRVTKTSAHGTLHVTTADTDAAGAPGMTCDSGTIAWKALTG